MQISVFLGAKIFVFAMGSRPAIRYIFCAEHRHKSMPLLSGLSDVFLLFIKPFFITVSLEINLLQK
jgi:hypothetical protein